MNKTFNSITMIFLISISYAQLFFSEYAEGSSNNKYLEIYNPTDEVVDLSLYAFPMISGYYTALERTLFLNSIDWPGSTW